jgi:hypothetical protein
VWPPRFTPIAWFKALSGQRRVPTAPALRAARRPPPQPSRHVPTASPAPPDSRLARAAVVPIARAPTAAVRSRVTLTAAGRLAVAVTRRRCATVSVPLSRRPRRLPCAGAEAVGRVAVGRTSAAHVGRAPRGHVSRHALCVWAESDFGPVAPG